MKLRSLYPLSRLALLASLATACGSNSDADAELEAIPEQAAFALSVSDDAASEGSASLDDAIDPSEEVMSSLDSLTEAVESEVAPELAHARGAVRALNQAVRRFMEPIVALVRDGEPTSKLGRVKVWGPLMRGGTEYRFTLRHGTLRHYGWVLDARVAGSNLDFTRVAAGDISVGFTARRGRGAIGLDLDALGSVDPTVSARGVLLARFAHGAAGSIVGYRLRDFAADADATPVNALVQGVHLQGGVNRLRLAYYGNLAETATDAPELVLARARHRRNEGGRADLLVTGGDVPNGRVWVVSECWSAALSAVYRRVLDCPGDGIGGEQCEVVTNTGDASACHPRLAELDLPPADAQAPMSDSESPEGDVAAPDAMPSGAPAAER